jgi:hypothetical protein
MTMGFDIYSRAAFAFLLMTTLCPAFMTRASNKSKRKQEERMGSAIAIECMGPQCKEDTVYVVNERKTA